MFVYMVFFANLFIENFSFYLSKVFISKKKHNKFHKFAKCCLTFNTNGFCPYLLKMAETKINLQFTDKIRILCALCYSGSVSTPEISEDFKQNCQ